MPGVGSLRLSITEDAARGGARLDEFQKALKRDREGWQGRRRRTPRSPLQRDEPENWRLAYYAAVAGCRVCGAEPSAGAHFCPNCGARLSEEESAARRAVTVVFTDISGFTSLAEHLDPESLRAVMERYYGEMRRIVQRHGGTVEGFIGDAVMAVFGIPRLHEDDSLRAVRAVVEMRSSIAALNADFEQDWGVTIEVHSGVNTGEVATSTSHDALVLGDAVNVAARLQQLASRGEILVGPLTARLVRDVAQLESMGAVAVKGKRVPIDTYRLVSLDTTGAVRPRRTTPVVGRERELDTLRSAWRAVRADRSCRLVTVVGPAGIGKTRLVSEFTRALEGEGDVLEGRCVEYGARIGLDPVAQMIRRAAGGLAEGVSAAIARAELVPLLDGVEDQRWISECLLPVLGFEGAATGPDETAWAVRKLFEATARRRPLVLVFEDLHWADPGLLEFIRHIRDWSQGAPLLLICLTRPETLDDRGWDDAAENASTVFLAPLSQADSGRLVESLVGGTPLSPRAMAPIVDAAQGNALYLEEVVSMLIDDGALRQDGERWYLVQEHSSIATPPSIRALLAARIDRLPPDRRKILEIAAVIGSSFWIQALSALHGADESGVREGLAWLVERDVVRELSDGLFHFAHALLRDAAYLGMTKESRARLHEELADWLATANDPVAGGDADASIGHHLEQAYRYLTELRPADARTTDLAGRAGKALAATGRRAFESGEMPAAASALRRAVSLLPKQDKVSLSLFPDLGEALMNVGELAAAIEAVEEGLAAALETGERQVAARLTLICSTHRLFTDPEGGAQALLDVQDTIPRLEALGDEKGLAKAWHLLAMVDVAQSRFAAAEHAMERAASHAQAGGDRRHELEVLSWLPLPIWIGPRPAEEGIRRYDEILANAGPDRRVEAMVLSMRAALEGMSGHLPSAGRSLGTARAIFEDLGLRLLLAGSSQIAGFLALLGGDAVGADRELESGMGDLKEMGETGLFSTVAGLRAHALFELARDDAAATMASLSEEAAGPGDLFSLVLARSARAKVLARGGQTAEGEALGRDAVRMARDTDSPQLIGDALLDLSRVLIMAGNPAQAVEVGGEAIHQFDRKGSVVSAARARTMLGELGASVS